MNKSHNNAEGPTRLQGYRGYSQDRKFLLHFPANELLMGN